MRKWLFIGGVTVLLIAAPLGQCAEKGPNPAIVERIRTLTLDGLERAYDLNFTGAEQTFDEAIALDSVNPRPHLSKAMLTFWQFLLDRNDSTYERLLSLTDRTIGAAEKYIDQYGENAEVLTCLGTAYGMRAFANGRAKSYLKAAWDGKKSYSYFVDATESDPSYADAYLGLGVFHYFASFLPKALQYVVAILGVNGDTERGIREIRYAADKGTYTRTEAQYYLSQLLPWYSGDFTSSEDILVKLQKKYPDNVLFGFTLAVWEIRRHDVRTAKDRLLGVLAAPNKALVMVKRYAQYKLAECYFRLDSLSQARRCYEDFLKGYTDERYVGTTNYRIGVCFEMGGQRDSAMKYYRRATRADNHFGDDRYSARKAAARLAAPFARSDSLLLQGQNCFASGSYDEAKQCFNELLDDQNVDGETRLEAQYGLGETLFEMNRANESLEQFRQVARSDPLKEDWLIPWSQYQMGKCYLKLGDTVAAERQYEKVTDHDDYDFENWLSFRTERELKRLERK